MTQFKNDLSFHFKNIKKRSKSLRAIEQDAKARGIKYSGLSDDLFNALYQNKPELINSTGDTLYDQTLHAVLNSPSFSKIRAQTKSNVQWSSVGASILLDEVSKIIDFSEEPEPPQPQEPDDNKGEDNKEKEEQESEDSDNESDDNEDGESEGEEEKESENGDGESDNDSDSEEESNEGNGESEESEKESDDKGKSESPKTDTEESESNSEGNEESEFEDGEEELDESDSEESSKEQLEEWDKPADKPQEIKEAPERIQQAIDQAAEKLEAMMGGLQQGSANSIETLDGNVQLTDELAALARNPMLAQILQQIGRLKLNNRFMAAMQVGEPEETVGITQGRAVRHALPRDLALLMGNEQEFQLFVNKYTNGELQQRQFKSNARPGKGPMIVCVDYSGSMSGQRQQWAITIAAAMYLQCLKDGRAFAFVPFSDYARVITPKNKKLDAGFLTQIINTTIGGGTEFQAAWTQSMAFLKAHSGIPWKFADVVFITDGMSGFNQDMWLKDKGKYNLRLFTFLIGVREYVPGQVWTKEELEKQFGRRVEIYMHLEGQKKVTVYDNLIDTSDATMFVERLDQNSEKQAFEMVKNRMQKKGQLVK